MTWIIYTHTHKKKKPRKKMIAKVAFFFVVFFFLSPSEKWWKMVFLFFISLHILPFCFILFNFHFIFSPIFSCNSPTLFFVSDSDNMLDLYIVDEKKKKKKNYYYYIRGGEWQRLRRPFFFCLCSQAMYQLFFFFFPFFFFFLFKILTYKVFLFRYPMDGWWVVACISPKNWSNSLHLWLNFESVKIWDPEMLLARCFSTFSQLWNTPLTRSAIEREREFLLFPCILLSTGKWIGRMLRRASQDRKHTSKTGSTRFLQSKLVFFFPFSIGRLAQRSTAHLYRRKSKLYSELKWWPSKARQRKVVKYPICIFHMVDIVGQQ